LSTLEDAAAWLRTRVGVGGIFTKEALRSAFPSVTQIDRRVRDLRGFGWVIDTRREDPTLSPAEMRLVKIGDLSRPHGGISPSDRRKALLATAYSCIMCGAAGGSTYPDAQHVRVVLQVVDPENRRGLVVCCARCRPDAESALVDASNAEISESVAKAAGLSSQEWAAACVARIARRRP